MKVTVFSSGSVGLLTGLVWLTLVMTSYVSMSVNKKLII